jgi:hypothetical protein
MITFDKHVVLSTTTQFYIFTALCAQTRPGGTILHFDTIKPTRSSPHLATPNDGSPSVACQHQQAVVGSTTPSSTKKLPHIPSTTDVELLRQYNKKYLGVKDYNPISAQLGKTFYTNFVPSIQLALPI